ncbi:undecaprenyl-diphosphatase [Thermomonospora echinospora]|uniref:Undecaprenyl-diphosphatase n=1 Tax=Thermomonospora echinospora TaxID=1992 RepID=A0A1H6E639_9ACTN|nr:bifunctional phosphatase PAP2/diacylglycerol kinase family protein [Thermomonospora echinospora]SEG93162.1 undecaprenyl-diphosphatase [Thermomonospora echinospora]
MRVNLRRLDAARPGGSSASRPFTDLARQAPGTGRGRRRARLRHHRALRGLSAIDRWAFDAVATARLPGLEYVLPRLSRAADNGVLWFTTAAVLGTTRRPRLRRAALRGSIAIALASPAVNLLGKHAFRRPRPVVDLVPQVRIRWKLPTSHAFPSGHSASAAGFATGVALEASPIVAVPVAVTAAAVAFARVYTGAHYPGDVLAGISIGVAAALGTRLVWPARPPVATTVHGLFVPGLVTEDGRGVVAVVNTGAGGGDGVTGLLARELPAAEIVRADPQDDLTKLLDEAAGRARVLAVVGGDGTVNAGARAALRHGVPLLTVPGGTLDHFSRALGIEHPADAVAAYRAGRLTRVDVGTVRQPGEEAIFLNTASFGAYTDLVDRRERLEQRIGKWPATAVAAVRTFRRAAPIEVSVDGRPRRVWLAFVGNGVYGSHGPAPTWRRRLDDGRLDVRLISFSGGHVSRLRALAAVLFGHLHLTPGYSRWKTTSLTLTAPHGDLRVARDGETHAVSPPVEFGKRPAALTVFCPAHRPGMTPAR